MPSAGVFPVHNNIFKINIVGRTAVPGDFATIKDLETFGLAVESNTEEWTPMDLGGWVRQAVTGKKLSISFSGKRNYGDPGNDYIGNTLLATGQACESVMEWTLPTGAKLTVNCVISLTTPAGGDSTNIDTLEFDILSDGLPVFTPAGTLSTLTYVTVGGSATGKTKVATVAPTLTGGNNYMVKVGANIASVAAGNVLTAGNGWADYTLGADITASSGQAVVIVEVNAGDMAIKGGTAAAIVT